MTRALRATVAAGIGVRRVEIGPDGKIVLLVVIDPADAEPEPVRSGEIVL